MAYDLDMQMKGDILFFRASGSSSIENNFDLCRRVLEMCRRSRKHLVLVDVRGIMESSEVIDLYQMAKDIHSMVRGRISGCALIQNGGDAAAFAESTMRHRGLNLRSFHDEEAAISWLLETRT